uniref:hypothetical protein n=1 Tax=Streptosporangium sp. CA-235898 TaxID=3240073 RepID=UPI003F49652F
MTGPLVSNRPVETDPDANPFTDLHCPECGQPFPGTIGVRDVMLTLCCEVEACLGADDGDCGCLAGCHSCPRMMLKTEARRGPDGNVRCGGCAAAVAPEDVKAAVQAALAALVDPDVYPVMSLV